MMCSDIFYFLFAKKYSCFTLLADNTNLPGAGIGGNDPRESLKSSDTESKVGELLEDDSRGNQVIQSEIHKKVSVPIY